MIEVLLCRAHTSPDGTGQVHAHVYTAPTPHAAAALLRATGHVQPCTALDDCYHPAGADDPHRPDGALHRYARLDGDGTPAGQLALAAVLAAMAS